MKVRVREFILYGIIVSIGLVLDLGLLYILTVHLELWYFLSAGISFTIALISNYFLSIIFVFKKRNLANSRYEFLIFAIIGISALCINQTIMYLSVDGYNLPILYGKFIALPLTFIWNFTWNKFLLFRTQ